MRFRLACLLAALAVPVQPAPAQSADAYPPVDVPSVPADTVLSTTDRAAAIALVTKRLNLVVGDTVSSRQYLPVFDVATERWPEGDRAEARARIEPLLTPEQAAVFRTRYFARQSDAVLAHAAAWLREPLIEMMLTRQVGSNGDSARAFLNRIDAQGYPSHLEARLPLVEAMIREIGYHEFVVSSFHRTMTLFVALANAYGEQVPLEAVELTVATQGAEQARSEVESSIRTHQFLYRDRPDEDLEHYIEALQSEAGQALLTLRSEVDAAREDGFNALILDQTGIQPSTWRPEAMEATPEAIRRDRVRVLLVDTGLAGLVGTFSQTVHEEVYAMVAETEAAGEALPPEERAFLTEVFADAFHPARNIDQLAYTLAETVPDSTLDTFEAWAADSLLKDVFGTYEDTVDRKRWDDLKLGPRDVYLTYVDDALGFSSLMVGIRAEVSWAAFSEADPQSIDAEAVDRFRTDLGTEMDAVWEDMRIDVLYEFTNALAHLSDAKVLDLAKRLRAPEAQAFLGWAYNGVRQLYAETATQALRRVALYAEGKATDADSTAGADG